MSASEDQTMKKDDQIVKKVAPKKFVKVIISSKGAKQDSKPQTTNGKNMHC